MQGEVNPCFERPTRWFQFCVRIARKLHNTTLAGALLSHLGDHAVHHAHVRHEERLYVGGTVHGEFRHEPVGNSDQSLLGPGQEPVDRRPRNQSGEFPTFFGVSERAAWWSSSFGFLRSVRRPAFMSCSLGGNCRDVESTQCYT